MKSRRGSITFIVAASVAAMAVLVLALFTTTADSTRWTAAQENDIRVRAAAESATVLVASKLWSDFDTFMAGENAQPWDFRFFMDSLGIQDQAAALKANAVVQSTNVKDWAQMAHDDVGQEVIDEVDIEQLDVYRVDDVSSSRLVVTATAVARTGSRNGPAREARETVEQVFVIEPPEWEGLNYALLANNINCLMCHMEVDRAARFYNDDPTAYGTYKKVKLGSIESFQLRHNPDSWLAGSVYLGGNGLHVDGTEIADWSSVGLKSRDFDPLTGLLAEDPWGDLSMNHLAAADLVDPLAGENLYLDYFSGGLAAMVDGPMPEKFPSPILDNGGYDIATGLATPQYADNRVVDHNEFMTAVSGAQGTISGGTIGLLPLGNTLGSATDVATFTAGTESALDSINEGNVYLHGTEANPIILNGEVAVDGDLIVSGYVKGQGSLMVSGNVYVPADIIYTDGTTVNGGRKYGFGDDGTQNTLAIASAGNIMVGDPYHPAWGFGDPTTGYKAQSFNFLLDEMALFNRMEWMKTKPTLPGEKTYQYVRTDTEVVVHAVQELVTWTEDQDVHDWVITGTEEQDIFGPVVVGTAQEEIWGPVVVGTTQQEVWGPVVTGTEDQPIWGPVVTGTTQDPIWGPVITGQTQEPVWGPVVTGTTQEPVYGPVKVGEQEQDVYDWVVILDRPPEYGGPILEWQVVGTNTIDIFEQQIVSYNTVDVVENQIIGYNTVDVVENQIIGYNTVDVVENQIIGYNTVDVVENQITGYNTIDVIEQQVVGYNTVDVIEQQVIGTQTVDLTEWQVVGTQQVTQSEWQDTGDTWTEEFNTDVYDWVVPDLTNPHYEGPDYIARYYGFTDGSPIPIYNKEGYFTGDVWVAPERAEDWDDDKLTYADPTDTSDPLLYDFNGDGIAVVSTVTPTNSWIPDDLLKGLIVAQQTLRDDTTPFEVDAMLYSNNSIFGLIPKSNAPGMNGELLVNGAVIAADVGLLAPMGTKLNFDPKGKDLLTIQSSERLTIKRALWSPKRMRP